MPPETEVISCPACKHLLRVPADWLGQTVQCPECKAKFAAPTRVGDALTDPVLLSAPPPAGRVAPRRPRRDLMLMLPAFGLMLVGIASLIANGVVFVRFATSPDGGTSWLKDQMPTIRQMGLVTSEEKGKENQAAQDEEAAAELAPKLKWVCLAAAVAGGVTFAGGLAMVLRKGYRLAQVACVVAALNLPNLCCVPGAIFGLWGLLMLMSDEGREHFAAV
jgi:hypothetical protein